MRNLVQKLFYSILAICFVSISTFAQTGKIKGFVYDKSTGEACLYANVFIENTHLGAATDFNGFFSIVNISDVVFTRIKMC